MPTKKNPDLSSGQKLLKLYQILFLDNKKHYQSDLAKTLNCSAQTIMRLASEIELASPECFQTDIENKRRWYRLQANHKNTLGLNYQELQYLSLCQKLSQSLLPTEITKRIEQTLLQLSMLMLEHDAGKFSSTSNSIAFFSKGKIDYSPYVEMIEELLACIDNHYFCHLHYVTGDNKQGKNHYFIPKKLIAMNNALYIYGAITDNSASKLTHTICLALHRIKTFSLIKQSTRIDIPEPNANTFGLPWHEPRTFVIKFNKEAASYVKERIWSNKQKIEELENGELLLTITTCSEPELMAWVRGFGEKVKSFNLIERIADEK